MAYYSDFNINFIPHPVTGDISILSDEKSINQSLKMLINMDQYEVPFNPDIGGNINGSLFEMDDSITTLNVKTRIQNLINNYEKRISLNDIIVTPNANSNSFFVTIQYTIISTSQDVTFSYYLERIV